MNNALHKTKTTKTKIASKREPVFLPPPAPEIKANKAVFSFKSNGKAKEKRKSRNMIVNSNLH